MYLALGHLCVELEGNASLALHSSLRVLTSAWNSLSLLAARFPSQLAAPAAAVHFAALGA